MGTQNGHNVPFLESASLKKRKRNVIKRIKQYYKISKKGNKKKIMPSEKNVGMCTFFFFFFFFFLLKVSLKYIPNDQLIFSVTRSDKVISVGFVSSFCLIRLQIFKFLITI